MGAYLSKPVVDKQSEDEVNETVGLSYGSSAMQGWRINQEDAANAILHFDEGVSLFAVYDGHGGHEVASYSATHLPKFLRKSSTYLKNNFSQALTDTFLQFDEYLVSSEVLNTLKQMASGKEDGDDGSDDESTQDEVSHLCKEATMPLEEVMLKYSELKQKFVSPKISKTMKSAGSSSDVPALDLDSSSELVKTETGEANQSSATESPKDDLVSNEICDSESVKSSHVDTNSPKSDSKELCNGFSSSQTDVVDPPKLNGVSNTTELKEKDIKDEGGGVDPSRVDSIEESNKVISDTVDSKKNLDKSDLNETNLEDKPKDIDGPTLDSAKIEEVKNQKNINGGSKSVFGKGKGKSSLKGKSTMKKPEAKVETSNKKCRQKRLSATKFYKQLQEGDELEDSTSDEESEDDSFCDIDEENDNSQETESGEEEDDVDEEEDCDEEEDLDDDDEEEDICENYQEMQMNMREEPGFDSGCTACIALFHGAELYVGNVGDSRCVVCRNDKAIDMSIDHKPEDLIESNRITKAGGRVTSDGRVNGGLNLSRALGDHSYKQNKNLPPTEQMISPLPDVKTISLTEEDLFVVIACDGIWNSMTSQEVCDFISREIKMCTKLSLICEKLFDNCLAPDVDGDGTGCDNMTCIIIRLDDYTKVCKSGQISNKRDTICDTGSIDCTDNLPQEKKQKLEA